MILRIIHKNGLFNIDGETIFMRAMKILKWNYLFVCVSKDKKAFDFGYFIKSYEKTLELRENIINELNKNNEVTIDIREFQK